jgi:4-hydroxy-tetrahydrodipicolinate synthase
VELWDAVKAGDQEGALKLHTRLLGLWNAIDGPNLPANVKTAMKLQGRKGGEPRPPMPATGLGQKKRILEALQLSGQG